WWPEKGGVMRVVRQRLLRGANLYSPHPCLAATIAFGDADGDGDAAPVALADVAAALARQREAPLPPAAGADLGQLVAQVAVMLQRSCGHTLDFVHAEPLAPGAAQRRVVIEYALEHVAQRALALAEVNRRLAGTANVECRHSDMLSALDGQFDLIISNPPYLLDPDQRAYRHGGGELGAGLSLRIIEAAIARLAPGGTLLLYTGVAIDNGEDPFLRQAGLLLEGARMAWKYEEIDPDVFGEELDTPAYAGVDRIAAVLLVARKGGGDEGGAAAVAARRQPVQPAPVPGRDHRVRRRWHRAVGRCRRRAGAATGRAAAAGRRCRPTGGAARADAAARLRARARFCPFGAAGAGRRAAPRRHPVRAGTRGAAGAGDGAGHGRRRHARRRP
ncbi:MAG TPA: methyltransferase, partial [Duganella sp.]|uniref:methyltransferase n=1 Tax=Duganella sp. TaxID=1904440 RepID=UPI002ED497CE